MKRLFIIGSLLFIGCQQKVEYLQTEAHAKRDLPFSEAVRVGNILYLSGKVGNIPGEMKLFREALVPKHARLWKTSRKS